MHVAGRQGTVYSCPAHDAGDGPGESSEITLDDATGLLLRSVSGSSRQVAVEVDADPAVDENTFATDIPSALRGPEDAVDDSGTPLPLTATDSVPRAGGGELHLADVRHGPSLVVIGELAGVTDVLGTVLPRTNGGTAPRVYVLLNPITASEEEPADPDLSLATEEGTRSCWPRRGAGASRPRPVGIDIKGGAAGEDLRLEEPMARHHRPRGDRRVRRPGLADDRRRPDAVHGPARHLDRLEHLVPAPEPWPPSRRRTRRGAVGSCRPAQHPAPRPQVVDAA